MYNVTVYFNSGDSLRFACNDWDVNSTVYTFYLGRIVMFSIPVNSVKYVDNSKVG